MKYDKQINVIQNTNVSDGGGGYTTTPSTIATLQAFTTPVKVENMLKQYGIVSTTALKIFTKDSIPAQYDYLEYNSKKYRVIQFSDFGKVKMFLIEVTQNG